MPSEGNSRDSESDSEKDTQRYDADGSTRESIDGIGEAESTDDLPGVVLDSDSEMVNRRRMLQALGAAGVTGLAGCGGGEDTPVATPTPKVKTIVKTKKVEGEVKTVVKTKKVQVTPEEQNTEPQDQAPQWADSVFNVPTPRVPKDLHWNNYNPTSRAGSTRNWVQEYLMGYQQAKQQFVSAPVFEDISIQGTTMTFTVADGVTWHSGKQLTGKDVATKLKMDVFMNQPPASVIDSVSTVDDKTAQATLSTKNKQIAKGVLAGRYFNTPSTIYGKYVKQFEDATSDDERKNVRKKVVQFEAEENGLGPFKITEATATEFQGKPHEGHPAYDAIKGVSLNVSKTTGNQGILQLGITGNIDYIGPIVLSQDALAQLPDYFQINPTTNLNGHGLFWNHENKHIQRRAFRQAIAHIADRKTIAKKAAGLKFKAPVGTPTGIAGVNKGIPQSWLGDKMKQFTAYETNTDKAATLLKNAGYSKSGGTWMGPDGSPVSLDLVYPGGWTDWVNAGLALDSMLKSFGFKTNFKTVDAPTWNGQTFPNGNFDITPRFWGGGRPHPFFGFRVLSNSNNQKNANIPQSFDVPMPIGNSGGSMQTIDLAEKTAQIPKKSGDAAKALVQELAWAVNQALPVLPVMEKKGAVWYATDDWDIPPASNPWMTVNPPTHLAWPLHEGLISPKRK